MHFLGDSEGNIGLWFDNKFKYGKWYHYTGAFYFEPELLWTDVPIDNDREGLYWRSDRKSFRWLWTVGTEVSKNNLDEDPEISGNINTASFVNGTWQFRRKTQIGEPLAETSICIRNNCCIRLLCHYLELFGQLFLNSTKFCLFSAYLSLNPILRACLL